MPTLEELRRQLDEEGVTDPTERNRRIAEEVSAGTLTSAPAQGMFSPQAQAPRYTPEQEAELQSQARAQASPMTQFLGQAGESWLGPMRQQIETATGAQTPARMVGERTAEEAVRSLAPMGAVFAPPEQPITAEQLPRGEGAFGPEMAPGQTPGAPRMGGIGMPSEKKLRELQQQEADEYTRQMQAVKDRAEKETQALGAVAELDAELARKSREVIENRNFEYEQLVADNQDKELERQKYIKGEFGKVQATIDELAKSKIDPYRFYRHPDGSVNYVKSIGSALAIGLGALGATLPRQYGGTGGPNMALQIIDRAIDRDIQAQRDDIANKRAGVGMQMNMLSHMRAQLGDERLAEKGAEIAMLNTANLKLEELRAKTQDQRVIANYDLLKAQLDNRALEKEEEFKRLAWAKKVQQEEGALGRGMQRTAFQAAQQARAAQATAGSQLFPGVRLADPNMPPPTKKDIETAKPVVGAWNNAKKLLDDLIVWRGKFGVQLPGGELATANTKLNRLKSAMRKIDETGARLDAGELEMMGLDFEMGDFGFIKERLNAVKESVRDKVAGQLYTGNMLLSDMPTAGARRR